MLDAVRMIGCSCNIRKVAEFVQNNSRLGVGWIRVGSPEQLSDEDTALRITWVHVGKGVCVSFAVFKRDYIHGGRMLLHSLYDAGQLLSGGFVAAAEPFLAELLSFSIPLRK